MSVFAISDLHLSINNSKPMNIFGPVWDGYLENIEKSWAENVTENDVVLLAGDLSWAMTLDEASADISYLNRFIGNKVLIKGNHDYWWKSISAVRSVLPENTYAVQNDSIKIGNKVICGSRLWATPEQNKHFTPEDKKIYDREVIRLKMSLDSAKKIMQDGDELYVMTHYPPFNSTFKPTPFTNVIKEYSPTAVVYGHLHGHGSRAEREVVIDGIKYFLTSCDLIGNKLVKISD
ncbi:MAG: metallophosphoesterase [Clostridia bacterium]|nr:metallophosphoesterase [Clostridia bacterium]